MHKCPTLVAENSSKTRKDGDGTKHEALVRLHGQVAAPLIPDYWSVDASLFQEIIKPGDTANGR